MSASTSASENNLAIWSKVEKTDPSRTKTFSRAGGFSGTAINQTYQTKRATELFGPIGIGWGFDEVEHLVADGANGDRVWFSKVRLWFKHAGERGEVIQWGATMFVGKNKNGQFTDEEAPKKSITDALGKCLSLLGFSADVYMGLYDDQKYVNDRRMEEARKKKSNGLPRDRQRQTGQAANGQNGHAGGQANGQHSPQTNGQQMNGTPAGQPASPLAGETSADASAVYSRAEEAVNHAESVGRLNEMRRKIREPQRGLSPEQIKTLDKMIDGRMQSMRSKETAA